MTTPSQHQPLHRLWPVVSTLGLYVAAGVCLIIWVGPIVWLFISSIKPAEIMKNSELTLFFRPTLDHFRFIFSKQQFLRYMLNSAVIAGVSTLIGATTGTMAAYAVHRSKKGGGAFTFSVLLVRMIPGVVLATPYFVIFSKMDLLNTWTSLGIAHIGFVVPFIVWLMLGYVGEVPVSLEEAAMVDGCTRAQAFFRVVVPLVRPGLSATAILAAIQSWNEFVYASVLSFSSAAKTLPVAAADFVTAYSVLWGPMFAAGVVIVLPVFIFTLLAQKQIVRGLTFGAVK